MRHFRRKQLSRSDLALWHAFTVDIVPLFGHERPVSPEPAETPPVVAAPSGAKAAWAPKPASRPAAIEIRIGEQPGGMDRRRWRALRKGDAAAERTLDLHGRRAQDAHAALRAFLLDASADGVRLVTVVTGKGGHAEGGILRRELPHWLNAPELRALVIGAAHPHPTNTGAVNILLRRRGRK